MGIDIRDVDQPVGTLSGGERQSVAIARAVHFGATRAHPGRAHLRAGRQAGRSRPALHRCRRATAGSASSSSPTTRTTPTRSATASCCSTGARSLGEYGKADITREELTRLMAGGAELEAARPRAGARRRLGGGRGPAAGRGSQLVRAAGGPPVTARRLLLGSCPDSWGVWFADDPRQPPWERFLDELAGVGYEWLELGPYGYLPTDPGRLADELGRRGLTVAGGSVHGGAGCTAPRTGRRSQAKTGRWPQLTAGGRQARGLRAGARLPRRHDRRLPGAGRADRGRVADDGAGRGRARPHGRGRRTGCGCEFHPHADSHVETQPQIERFLADTDPAFVSLCLDTGHVAYRRRRRGRPDPPVSRSRRLRAHQADGPGRGGEGRGAGPRVRPGGGDGRKLRAAGRRAGCRRRSPRRWPAWPGWPPSCSSWSSRTSYPVRRRRARADRPAHPRLPARGRHRQPGRTASSA